MINYLDYYFLCVIFEYNFNHMNIFDVTYRQRFLEEAFVNYRTIVSFELKDNTILMRCKILYPSMIVILVRVCKDLCFDFDIISEDYLGGEYLLITFTSNI